MTQQEPIVDRGAGGAELWAAIDAVTESTTMPIQRDRRAEWLVELENETSSFCRVDAYRAMLTTGKIPSLWEQAEMALHKTGETDSGNRSHLATRSPADVVLMETMLTIRETVDSELRMRLWNKQQRKYVVPLAVGTPLRLRQLGGLIASDLPEWAYKVAQWQRLLENYLQAVDNGPKPMRIRYRCPLCKTEYIHIPDPDGGRTKTGEVQKIQLRPIVAVYRDHWFRCFECEACTHAWWGDSGVHQLKADIKADEESRESVSDLDETMTA